MPIGATTHAASRMSAREFRAFQAGRPDHERWELIGGVAVMMTPPTIAHNRIAGNLERLLNAGLAAHDPRRLANQRPGVELGRIRAIPGKVGTGFPIGNATSIESSEDFRPEPDVAVIDADYEPDQRFVERAYLLAEVVSRTDNEPAPGTDESWIEVKRRLYLAHQSCEAVLVIEQDWIEVRVDLRSAEGWVSRKLTEPGEELVLAGFGLRCLVAELYEGTPLHPRGRASRQ
jgi:Uma2 family endonuclease